MFVAAAVHQTTRAVPNALSVSALAVGLLVAFAFGRGGPWATLEGGLGAAVPWRNDVWHPVCGLVARVHRWRLSQNADGIWDMAGMCLAVSEGCPSVTCGPGVGAVDILGGRVRRKVHFLRDRRWPSATRPSQPTVGLLHQCWGGPDGWAAADILIL